MLVRFFRGRRSLLLENLDLRQQLVTLKRRNPRPSLGLFDKLFWVIARRVWSAWKQSLLIVTPETVVHWHRTGFCMYWRLISRVRRQVGRKRTPKEVRELIFCMLVENPTWGAPRIHGELRMLGFELSERTISRWMKRARIHGEILMLGFASTKCARGCAEIRIDCTFTKLATILQPANCPSH
jgi:putative transposase